MTDGAREKLIAIFVFSEQERARVSPLRLRALTGEARLAGAELAVVTTGDVSPETGAVEGEVLTAQGWRRRNCDDLSVVVFNARPLLMRQKQVYAWLKGRFPSVEASGRDKSKLTGQFAGTELERILLPEAMLPREGVAEALEALALRFGGVVVKPVDGYSGRNIRFLTPRPDGAWALQLGAETVTGDLKALSARAAEDISGRARYRQYLVQTFVRSLSPEGRALQLRVDLHKDQAGVWRLIWSASRLGAYGKLVANRAQGGFVGALGSALEGRPGRDPVEISDEAVRLSFAIAETVDRDPTVQVHELGIDLAVDDDGRIWLIETNVQPQTIDHELERAALAIPYYLARAERAVRTPTAADA